MMVLVYFMLLLYTSVLLLFIIKLTQWHFINKASANKQLKFSILIPFKDEANRIKNLLDSLQKIKYNIENFEIIFIDDHSEDGTSEIIMRALFNSKLKYKIIKQDNALQGKKSAVISGINAAVFDFVFTTDADCHLPSLILQTYNNQFLASNADLIFGPVSYLKQAGFWSIFQYYDCLAMQAVTKASCLSGQPMSCNAANMAYKKARFKAIKPYQDNMKVASGDDQFLLECFQKHNLKIGYLQSAQTVLTLPAKNFKELINQRKRWFGKQKFSKNTFGSFVNFIILMGNFSLIVALILLGFNLAGVAEVCLLFVLKFTVDLSLIYSFSKAYRLSLSFLTMLLINLIYPFLLIGFVFSLANNRYIWKSKTHKTST